MTTHDLQPFLDRCASIVRRHALGAGASARWAWQDALGSRALGPNGYGCADAINILYTLGALPEGGERRALAAALNALQDPTTGLFTEATHDPIHTTAHCVAALELLDARPQHPLEGLAHLRSPAAVPNFLDALDWSGNPWGESHKGAGAYAALVVAGEVGTAWEDRYFGWLWDEADPETGFWRRGKVAAAGDEMRFHHLAGSFHYLFNHEYARRPLRFPERMIDSCLQIRNDNLFPWLGSIVGFAEVDWVYCLHRARRQCGHRFADVTVALESFAEDYLGFLAGLDPEADEGLNDLHQLFGALCALAELQQALPGRLRSDRPLRLVLDRRPFI